MPDYPYPGTLLADPVTFQRATNASITVYDINDLSESTPLALKDLTGLALANPLKSSADAFVQPFIAPVDGVKLVGAGLTVVEYSHQGMKDAAEAAAIAAQSAAAEAAAAGSSAAAVASASLASAVADAEAAATAAVNAAALVGTPADTAIAAAVNGTGATKAALNATYVGRGELTFNVKDYGAKGDFNESTGVGTDDSAAIQAAINAAPSGSEVFFPVGTYLMRQVSGTGKSNITLRGVRGASKLQYKAAGAVDGNNLIGWNETANPATNARNVTIRDLWFKGVAGAVVEHQAQLHMSAIDNLTVKDCIFTQFQGDAINIARTRLGGTDMGVVNRRVKIVNNIFDGIDYTNRNAITLIAGDDVLIQGNSFTRCSAPNMPGAIDIEPNVFDTTASITDIKILDNTFTDCGGNSGDIGAALVPSTFTAARWHIKGNTHSGGKGPALRFKWHNHAGTDTDPFINMHIKDNMVGQPDASYTGAALIIEGLRGWTVDENRFTNWAKAPLQIGYDSGRTVKDGSITRNYFIECGATDNYLINLNYGNRVEVSGNRAYKSGAPLSALLLVGATSNTTDIVANDNRAIGINNVVSFGGGITSVSTNHAQRNLGFISSDPEPTTFFYNLGRSGYYAAKTVTVNYTVTRSDSLIITNGSNITATLPDPALVSRDRQYVLKNINATALTVASAASKNIDGAASQPLAQWGKGVYVSDGTQWLTV